VWDASIGYTVFKRKTRFMTTRQISIANLVILGVYVVLCAIMIISTATMHSDAAGEGMAWGFTMVAAIYTVILAALNLVRKRWFRFVVLVIGLIPIVLFLMYTFL